ncbi:dsk2p [Saccharomyces arboricola H-6]|uniref:Dsk2p n=1 Tax=Saccharomyces arboricola (strain H-6 / AS 2.3317 / CBS 10644) TaxID=1160507 RepID=J8PPU3_SACAR|nr:dsk2p [Saccharomyces arboricola H-6]
MSLNIHIKSGQDKWEVTVAPESTVQQFKEAISEANGIPVANQRLIYSGKILKDDQTVESYHIQDGHSVHLVKSQPKPQAGAAAGASNATATANAGAGAGAAATPNMSSGQNAGFNPLADLTSARYAGYLNMPSTDMFGPDGGALNNDSNNQDELLRMMENPIFQSQMNEMLSNPQMLDFMIQSNPQLQAMGPQARQMLQSPMFRQMLTNPDMIRQSMQFARMMDPNAGAGGAASAFPAPGGDAPEEGANATNASAAPSSNAGTNTGANAAAANPFASLLNPALNPFTNAGNPAATGMPAFDPALLASMFQPQQTAGQASQPEDTRPPEERYEHQLRQLNDMGFFDFDRNVAALRRSGGSVQGALDSLLNGDI